MQAFTVRDLRERTGDLIRGAEAGDLSVITKYGTPVFLAVPFTDQLLESGVRVALAIQLFDTETLTLVQAAKFAGLSTEAMIERIGAAGVAILRQPDEELDAEVEVIERHGRRG
ncbi:MAG: UPF0175 family protein [Rhodocyclaceae bacterium]|nr:UPF0175 family protein [Rhodocyclaceae bacterium]